MNTSATGGYLAPTTGPLESQSFDDFLQQVIVGISGVDGQFVRPRWQPEPPNLPKFDVDWIAFGIQNDDPDVYGYVGHNPNDGTDNLQRHETVEILMSFYGPNAAGVMGVFRDGLLIAQNREVFQLNAIGQQQTGPGTRLPRLDKNLWLMRIDMVWTIRRLIQRSYPVLNINAFVGGLFTDVGIPPFQESLTA